MVIDLLFTCTILFIVTFLLLKAFIPHAKKFGLLDIPNERSSHKSPTPRGAGIIFGSVSMIGISIFYILHFGNFNYSYALLSLIIIYATGIYDDIFKMKYKIKFLFILIAIIIAYYHGIQITSLGTYFGYDLNLGYLSLPFTIFAIAGFTNALNLTDGLDGLAGSISVVILLGLFIIGKINSDWLLMSLSILLVAPLLAFLIFNWYPAKIFMGDSGSLFLGFSIALLSVYALKYINPVSVLFLTAIPMFDTLIVMRRRVQRKQSMFVADKNHLHHILFKFKGDSQFTVINLIQSQIIFVLIFIQVYNKSNTINLVLFLLLFTVLFNLFDPRSKYRRN